MCPERHHQYVSIKGRILLANLFQHHKAELSAEVAPKPGRLQRSDRRGEISALPGPPTVSGRFRYGWGVPKTDACGENGPNHRSSTLTTSLVTAHMRRMTPIAIKNATHVLGKPEGWDEESRGTCNGLPVIQSDGVFYSYWRASWRERMRVLFAGKVRLCVASAAHPPVMLDTDS
jgi:hypothetical protein